MGCEHGDISEGVESASSQPFCGSGQEPASVLYCEMLIEPVLEGPPLSPMLVVESRETLQAQEGKVSLVCLPQTAISGGGEQEH